MIPDRMVGAKAAREPRPHMGFLEAETSPYAHDSTSGPMSGHFNALPLIIDAGIPTAALSRDALEWRRWTEFCAGVRTQPWRLD